MKIEIDFYEGRHKKIVVSEQNIVDVVVEKTKNIIKESNERLSVKICVSSTGFDFSTHRHNIDEN